MSTDDDMLYECLHESWDEIEELKAENAALREQKRYLMKGDLLHCLTDSDVYEQQKREREMQASIIALDDECGKLRDLVRELWNCAASLAEDSIYHIEGAVCGCGICCVVNGEDCSAYKLRDRIRELGVEV